MGGLTGSHTGSRDAQLRLPETARDTCRNGVALLSFSLRRSITGLYLQHDSHIVIQSLFFQFGLYLGIMNKYENTVR